jgi:hypothetical protein
MDPGKSKKKKDKEKRKSEEKERTHKVKNVTKDDDDNNNNNNNNKNDGDGNKINKKEMTTSSSSQRPAMNAGSMVVVDHPFIVDDSDHCETPLNAYQDLEVVLDRLLLTLGDGDGGRDKKEKKRSELIIYDPYYCDGGVKDKLSSMGYTNVINNNRDFYKDISTNSIPEYDVLITNPPYSADHIEKILEYVVSMSSSASTSTENNKNKNNNKPKPCFLLLPHFVYTKDYYERTIGRCCSNNNNNSNNNNSFFYFLIPEIRYAYVPPDWVNQRRGSKALAKGKETTAPFPSFWYCHTPSSKSTSSRTSSSSASNMWLEETFGMSGQIRSKHNKSKLRYAKFSKDIPRDFKGEFDTTKKRPNPKARKRLRLVAAQKRAAGASAGANNVKRAGAAGTNANSAKKKKRY